MAPPRGSCTSRLLRRAGTLWAGTFREAKETDGFICCCQASHRGARWRWVTSCRGPPLPVAAAITLPCAALLELDRASLEGCAAPGGSTGAEAKSVELAARYDAIMCFRWMYISQKTQEEARWVALCGVPMGTTLRESASRFLEAQTVS